MTIDRISILLETCSYFFVTLDLFGKERLDTLYKRIIAKLSSIEPIQVADKIPGIVTKNYSNFMGSKGCLSLLTVGLIALVIGVVKAVFKDIPSAYITIIFLTLYMIGPMILYPTVIFIIKLLEGFINLTLGNIVKLLFRYKLEGIMLAIGTVLFLTSKAVAFLN